MDQHKKILFLPKWYPSRVQELNGSFIRRHAAAVALKHSVAALFISADPNMKGKTYDTELETDQGIMTVKIFYNNSLPDVFIFSSLVKFVRSLVSCWLGVKIINEKFGKPDICHIHVLARTSLIALYFKYFDKIPFIISEHWSGYLPEDGTYKGFLKKLLTKIAIKKSSSVTTVSESLRNAMLQRGLTNDYHIIPNIIDTQVFFPALQKEKKNKFIILHASNLYDRAKNISGMIRAMKKLSEQRSDFELHIVGDGKERNGLEEMSKNFDLLNKFIFFHGWKTSPEVAEMMRGADITLLFSNYETNSCLMLESFASGVPVIGSSIPALSEYMKKDMGILVPPWDENALCNAISKAMDHIGVFNKEKMRDYAKENFSYEAIANKFDAVYNPIFEKSL